jgi:hypothetical protein
MVDKSVVISRQNAVDQTLLQVAEFISLDAAGL